jgi:hypothetical protein
MICTRDHMHQLGLHQGEVVCKLTLTWHDNPEPVDAYESVITDYRNYVWTVVPGAKVTELARMVADAKNEMIEDVWSSVSETLPVNPVGLKAIIEADERDIDVVRDIWGGTNRFIDFLHFKTSTRGRDLLTYNQPTTESSTK